MIFPAFAFKQIAFAKDAVPVNGDDLILRVFRKSYNGSG